MSESKKEKRLFISLIVIAVILLALLIYSVYYGYKLTKPYKNKMYPNVYIEDIDISNIKLNKIEEKISQIEESYQSKKVIFQSNTKSYEYTLKDLGIGIDKDKLQKEIKDYHKDLSYSRKILIIKGKKKKVFSYHTTYKKKDIETFVDKLKVSVDMNSSDGKLIMDENRNLHYQEASSSFYLDKENTLQNTLNYIENGMKDEKIELVGSSTIATDSPTLKTIDTKVSSYSTKYNAYISRGRNLETALNYLDGNIINPGEVFSYFHYAGPYNKAGYVWYDKMIGNGTCQIASTIYNTALLAGVEIVERHQHGNQLTYVPGGRDATVVSNGNKSLLDFKFKNTYKYPIYISAYYKNGVATVDFWSNSNAKEGKTYDVESISLGNKTYETYLHTYQNGVDIGRTFLAKTHYYKT